MGLPINFIYQTLKSTLLFLLSIFVLTPCIKGQETETKSFQVPLNSEVAFEKIIDFALDKGLFISHLEKKANFLQLNKLSKNGKSLVSYGKRITYNFLIRKKDGSTSIIFLQVKVEDHMYKNYVSYYVDKGITNDYSYYTPIIQELKMIMK